MTEKQRKFGDEYIVDCNMTQAAIRAGYSPDTAYSQGQRLLKNVEVKKYIEERLEQIRSEKTANAKEVMEYLTSVMRGEHTEQVLRLIGEGTQKIDDIAVSEKDRLKAAELIGKRYGLFKENVDIGGADTAINIKIDYGEENGHKDTG